VIPVGRYFGIKDAKKHNAVENPILEAAYRRSKSPDSNALMVSQLYVVVSFKGGGNRSTRRNNSK
jgi:hypothetical protein